MFQGTNFLFGSSPFTLGAFAFIPTCDVGAGSEGGRFTDGNTFTRPPDRIAHLGVLLCLSVARLLPQFDSSIPPYHTERSCPDRMICFYKPLRVWTF